MGIHIRIALALAQIVCFPFSIIGQDGSGGTHEKWEYILEDSGDILQLALPISAGAMSLIKRDYDGTKKLALSYSTTIAITYSLKYLVHKQRPEGRYRFDSFPSGHTASAFSGASFIQRRYGWKYGWPAYVLAGIVGISRMEGPDGYHDIIDVAAGAAIGIGSTYIFTKPYSKNNITISFSSGKDHGLLMVSLKF